MVLAKKTFIGSKTKTSKCLTSLGGNEAELIYVEKLMIRVGIYRYPENLWNNCQIIETSKGRLLFYEFVSFKFNFFDRCQNICYTSSLSVKVVKE